MDLASINKVEVLAWEGWGSCAKAKDKLNEQDINLFKKLADLLRRNDIESFEKCRKMFETHPSLKIPKNYKPWKAPMKF